MDRISRRRFVADSLLAVSTAAIPGAALALPESRRTRRVSPNEQIRVAVIGFGGRGMNHIEAYLDMDDVVLATICDADSAFFEKGLAAARKKGKREPTATQDLRRVLDDKSIDAVSIATPNHWHALAAIWALQAGKDVYVEKPVSHNVSEGRRIVEAARKYDRICQTGTQSRASAGIREAMEYLHSGRLGHIHLARGLCYKPRPSIGKVSGPQKPPASVDYDLWLGPAPMKPVMRQRFHYDWHWVWDTGNGDLGNQGIHEMDKARWGLNKPHLPYSFFSLGGRYGYVDDGETPNTLVSFFDYGDSQLVFEVRGLPTKDFRGAKIGNIFYGDQGIMVMPSYSEAAVYDTRGNKVREFKGGGDHFRNFIDAMRSRRRENLYADIEEGHLSSALCHLGNISYLLRDGNGAALSQLKSNPVAEDTVGRMLEHLAENGVKLDTSTLGVGKVLAFGPKSETFPNDPKANQLLTRPYRKGYEVPARV